MHSQNMTVDWIDSIDLNSFEWADCTAKEKNKLFKQQSVSGVAQAVFGSRNGSLLPQWRVRTFTYHLSDEGKFSTLIKTFQDTIAFVRSEQEIVEPDKIVQKLNKLIFLILKTPSINDDANAKLINNLNVFRACQLSVENQFQFKRIIQDTMKVLLSSGSLEEITYKIATLAQKKPAGGSKLYNRLKELMGTGTQLIPQEKSEDQILLFIKVFALHVFVFKPDADSKQASIDLASAIKKIVQAFRFKPGKVSNALCWNIIKTFLENMKLYLSHKRELASLAWTLEAFLNESEFVNKLPKETTQDNAFLKNRVIDLFEREESWPAMAGVLVTAADTILFSEFLTLKICHNRCDLNETQLNFIFFKLNQALKSPTCHKNYLLKCQELLKLLAHNNCLHYLISYGCNPLHQEVLRECFKRLDLNFMKGLSPQTFFGNATYRALFDSSINRFPNIQNYRSTILFLFSQCRTHPVKNIEAFSGILTEILSDLNDNLAFFAYLLLGRLGEITAPSQHDEAVEIWLQNRVLPLYQVVKRYSLLCLLAPWHHFNPSENHKDKLCLIDGELYTILSRDNEEARLQPLTLRAPITRNIKSALFSDEFSQATKRVQEELRTSQCQKAFSALVEAVASHHYDKERSDGYVQELVNLLIHKLSKDEGEKKLTATEKMTSLENLLKALAPFFRYLETEVKKRFFPQDKLKTALACSLVEQTQSLSQREIKPWLAALKKTDEVDYQKEGLKDLTDLVSFHCSREIKSILEECPLPDLKAVSAQFEYVVCRKLDELSYSSQEFITAFCKNSRNYQQISSETLKEIMNDLPLRESIMNEYGQFLRKLNIPINFILPNQALAMQLCQHTYFENKHLLIKLGTGQGKSLIIALAALQEARRITHKGLVFVFTSYDHLAQRDHKLGQTFFQRDAIESICISRIEDIERFSEFTKIIYADVANIESLIRAIMIKLLENKATPKEISFIKIFYEANDNFELRIILDEYDLLLHDLKVQPPYSAPIPFLNVKSVEENERYWPLLKTETTRTDEAAEQTKTAAEPSSGLEFSFCKYFERQQFNLLPCVMRLSHFLKRAKRIIGLSGSAEQENIQGMSEELYFEIPSSQNPEVFGTQFQETPSEETGNSPTITCHCKKEIDIGQEEKPSIITPDKINEYCEAIINDIKKVREQRRKENGTVYQRPILIFADPHLVYKSSPSSPEVKLWDTLSEKIRGAGIDLNELTGKVDDQTLQNIARSGKVTLSSIQYGRGADIRVSLDIEEGLHVIVGTGVIHKRLLSQLIGRTGRMGRKGSYSAITLGPLIKQINHNDVSTWYEALHELTKFFVQRVVSSPSYDPNLAAPWLMVLNRAFRERKINKPLAMELCSTFFNEQLIPPQYFTS